MNQIHERGEGLDSKTVRPICLIVDRIAKRSGGAERVVVELANAFARRGHPVHILTYERTIGNPFYRLEFGVTSINLRYPNRMRTLPGRVLDLARRGLELSPVHPRPLRELLWNNSHLEFEQALSRYFTEHRPHAAIAFLPPSIVALARARRPPNLRIIASLHNVPELDLTSSTRWDPNPLDLERRMEAIRMYPSITVLQPEFRDWFPEPLRQRVTVMPNIVHPVEPSASRSREKVLLYVGRLAPPKRVDLLLEAWALLAPKFPDYRVHIRGGGSLQAKLEGQAERLGIRESVHFLRNTRTVSKDYHKATLLVHPADYEGWGLSVSEALAHGLPAVAFADCPGVNQLIKPGLNGELVAPQENRAAALAQTLERLLSNPELMARYSAAAPGSVANLSSEHIIPRWHALLFPEAH